MSPEILYLFFMSVSIILFSSIIYSIIKINKKISLFQRKLNAKTISLDLLLDGNFNLNQKVKDLDSGYANLINDLSRDQFKSSNTNTDKKFYKQAKQLKQIGADSESIKYSCNLSQMEMELIEALDDKK